MTKVNMGMLEQPVHEPLDPEFMPTKAMNPRDILRGLTVKQRRALPLIAAGYTGIEVAKAIGCGSFETTV
jgi:hypothetical protein